MVSYIISPSPKLRLAQCLSPLCLSSNVRVPFEFPPFEFPTADLMRETKQMFSFFRLAIPFVRLEE